MARIKFLYNEVQDWSDSEVTTLKHDVWSIKKLLVLDYYIEPFVNIMQSNKFNFWYYVDPFSGSGLLKLRERYLFPGSSVIPLLRANQSRFHRYYLSDTKSRYISALRNRVMRISQNKNTDAQIQIAKFSTIANDLFTGNKPSNWKRIGYLVFLDPFGLQVQWKDMERILKSGAVDIIFTFMTWAIVWNKNKTNALSAYFGDDGWKTLKGQEDFVSYYCKKIEQVGYTNKYKTFPIDVTIEGGRRYDLILATQSSGAANVLKDLKEYLSYITTQSLNRLFSVSVGAQSSLDSFKPFPYIISVTEFLLGTILIKKDNISMI